MYVQEQVKRITVHAHTPSKNKSSLHNPAKASMIYSQGYTGKISWDASLIRKQTGACNWPSYIPPSCLNIGSSVYKTTQPWRSSFFKSRDGIYHVLIRTHLAGVFHKLCWGGGGGRNQIAKNVVHPTYLNLKSTLGIIVTRSGADSWWKVVKTKFFQKDSLI